MSFKPGTITLNSDGSKTWTNNSENLKNKDDHDCANCGYSPIPHWANVCKICYAKGER